MTFQPPIVTITAERSMLKFQDFVPSRALHRPFDLVALVSNRRIDSFPGSPMAISVTMEDTR